MLAGLLLLCWLGPAAAQGRVALVVGNSGYLSLSRLVNPKEDARVIAAALSRLGFEGGRVQPLYDLDMDGLVKAVRAFGERARGAELAVVYFSGHGLQLAPFPTDPPESYLLPVDVRLEDARDVPRQALALRELLAETAGGRTKGAVVILLDACRNNPDADRLAAQGKKGAARSGLVPVDQSKLSRGTLVSYATSAGKTADDGNGRNSPYAAALARHLGTPGLDVVQMLRRVRADVMKETGDQQEPEIIDKLSGDVILAGPVQPGTPGRVDDPRADDTALWAAVRDSNRADDFEAYLRRFPQGLYADLARIRLRVLQPGPEGRSFNVVNRTGLNLTALHAVRSPLGAQQEWGRSLLASNRPIRPDAAYGVSPAEGAGCRFDLRVVLADGRESVLLNQDICTRRELEMDAPPRPPIVPPHDSDEQPGATEIGRFKAWTAAAYVTKAQKTCYAFTDAAGNFEPKQNPVMLMVSHRPNARDTVLISAGYPFPAGAKVLVTIGATQLPFDTVGKTAAAQQGAAVVASMRNGSELRAAGAGPGNGEQVTYSFPLAGFTAAYEAISRSCPPSPQPGP